MSTNQASLPEEVRERIDQHLDAVEAELQRSGTSRAERRSVTDDLEAQILEMLASRCSSAVPTAADVEKILGELDPPQLYSPQSGAEQGTTVQRTSAGRQRPEYRLAHWAVCAVVVGLLSSFTVWCLLAAPSNITGWLLVCFLVWLVSVFWRERRGTAAPPTIRGLLLLLLLVWLANMFWREWRGIE